MFQIWIICLFLLNTVFNQKLNSLSNEYIWENEIFLIKWVKINQKETSALENNIIKKQ